MFNNNFIEEREIEAREFFKKFLVLPKTPNDYKLKIIVVVGKQGFGKTKFMEYLNWRIFSIPTYWGLVNCVNMKDLRTLYNPKFREYWELPVQVLNYDDAARIFDSHDSMKNTEKTRDYFDIRHIYKEECHYGSYGIIFMIINIQTLRRLEVSMRETYDVMIIENYFDSKWFKDVIRSEELRDFAREFTRNASAFSQEEEKRFCIGRNIVGEEFMWSIPIEDIDPETDETMKITKLLKKYNVLHEFGIDTLEQQIYENLKRDLLYHDYFELKSQKQLRGWLKRISIEKYETEIYRIEFSKNQFNNLIEIVSDLRFDINLKRKIRFYNYLKKKIHVELNSDLVPFEKIFILAKQLVKKKKLFFLKEKELRDMVKEITFNYQNGMERDDERVYTDTINLLKTNPIMDEQKGPIKSFIRKSLIERDLDPLYFNKSELTMLIEDAQYEYINFQKIKNLKNKSCYVMNLANPTLKNRIVGHLFSKGLDTIARTTKAIKKPDEDYDKLYAKVNSELNRNKENFLRNSRGLFCLKHNNQDLNLNKKCREIVKA